MALDRAGSAVGMFDLPLGWYRLNAEWHVLQILIRAAARWMASIDRRRRLLQDEMEG